MVTNLGNVAVNKAVFVIHNEVFEILGREHPALPRVAQTRLLQQLPAAVEGPLGCQQLQLLVMRTMWRRRERGTKRGDRGRKKQETQKHLLKICCSANGRSRARTVTQPEVEFISIFKKFTYQVECYICLTHNFREINTIYTSFLYVFLNGMDLCVLHAKPNWPASAVTSAMALS